MVLRMTSLPCLIFSSCDLCEEVGVSDALPEKPDLGSLRHLFFSRLGRARADFLSFCSAPASDRDYRIYPLDSFGGFRAAFCEKCRLGSTELTVVFLARSVTAFSRCMSPFSRRCASAVDRMLFELLYLRDGGVPPFSSLSPELFLVVSRMSALTEAILSRRCGMRPCDLRVLMNTLAEVAGTLPYCGTWGIRLDMPESENAVIPDVPVEALAAVLAALFSVLFRLSRDDSVSASLTFCRSTAQIALETRSGVFSGSEDGGLDVLLRAVPEDLCDAVKLALVLCALSRIDARVRSENGGVRVSVLVGQEAPLPPDFKFSDPTGAIKAAFAELIGVLASPSAADSV